jgi:predicted Fe-S protein YdhL (DUF1289 family)
MTATRTWDAKPLRPEQFVPWHDCTADELGSCIGCVRIVEIKMRTADGRTLVSRMTPDEADALADQIRLQAEMARALGW